MLTKNRRPYVIQFLGMLIATIFLTPVVQAQNRVLEEITVTAQRREQSIQEVPISLETFSGADLNQEGLRSMTDLANFSPSTEIDFRIQDQTISVRGLGTSGSNPGLEQAVPIFVDGVHYGRSSMVMGAFLDLEQVEILRGPQPVAFGMNATAGAFSMVTRKPGTEWEGDLTGEYGNFGRASVEGGVGGPITDTLGIRLAGQYDRSTGFVKDIVSGSSFPFHEEKGARLTLQWAPTDNFEATLKAEYLSRTRKGDGNVLCRTRFPVSLNERAVTVPGLTSFDNITDVLPIPSNCADGFSRVGIQEGRETPFKPVPDIFQEDIRTGIIDISSARNFVTDLPGTLDNLNVYNYRLGLDYEFNNGITLSSITAYVDYDRNSIYDNSSSPILTNFLQKGEILDMYSQEFRVLSPRGGMIEWEAGVFHQKEDSDFGNINNPKFVSQTVRANIRRPVRVTDNWQDSKWSSAFASLTFNFLDDKASIDIGGRYTDVKKVSHVEVYGRTWIFDVDPIDALTGRANSTNLDGTVRNKAGDMIDCATGHFQCGSSFGAGFYTAEWRTNDIPDVWNTLAPVGVGPLFQGTRDTTGEFDYDYNDSSLDPQVTLRYRPSDEISLYGKWAKAFKAGGSDIAPGSLPDNQEEFELAPEFAQTFELGAKGTLLDGAASFNLTLFTITVKDLQVATNIPTAIGGGSQSTNAGKQRTRGVEFDLAWAATEHLTAGLTGAIMDGVMLSYPGAGCTDFEFETADTGPCLTATESDDLFGTEDFEGTIDRTGASAPRTPDWKFVLNVDYWYPVFNGHKVTLASRTTFSDGWLNNVQDFEERVKYGKRTIANLTAGVGDMDETWKLNFWIRNILGKSQGIKYFPEFDPERSFTPFDGSGQYGVIDTDASTRDYTTYGVQLNYNF